MSKIKNLIPMENELAFFELGHTAYLFAEMVERSIVENYDLSENLELKELAETAMENLYALYQRSMGKIADEEYKDEGQ